MLKKIIIILFTIIAADVVAQNVTWEKFIPGRLYKDEGANDICLTTDGNFLVVGTSEGMQGNPSDVIEAVKINGYGDTLWIKRYHPPNTTRSRGKSCCSSKNGSVVLTGYAGGGLTTAFLTKLDVAGNILWNKEYSTYGITYDGHQVFKTFDGGYIVRGYDFILKTDSVGNYKWHKHISNYGFSNFINLTISHSGEYLVIYNIYGYPNEEGVVKFDEYGNLIWKKIIPSSYKLASLIKNLTNSYLLMGFFLEAPQSAPFYIFTYKMNEEGIFSSYKETKISNRVEYFDGAANVINDNKFVFVTATHIQSMLDTQYCVFSMIDSTGNILKTNEIKSITDTSVYFKYRFIHSALPLTDGYIMYAGFGQIQAIGAAEDFYIVRADSNLFFQTVGINSNQNILPEIFQLHQNYPNPFNPITKIKFDVPKNSSVRVIIYDVLGREITTLVNRKLKAGIYEVSWDASEYPSGVYFYRLSADGNVIYTKKMLLVK